MTFVDVLIHLRDNWHKYGILFLVIKELRGVYKFIANIKAVSETFGWLNKIIKSIF